MALGLRGMGHEPRGKGGKVRLGIGAIGVPLEPLEGVDLLDDRAVLGDLHFWVVEPDSSLGFHVKVFLKIQSVCSSLGCGRAGK